MFSLPGEVVALIGLALIFDFLNGFNDSSTIVATMISSRAIAPRRALMLTAVAEAIGPFLFGVAVASAIGREIVDEAAVTLPVLIAALAASIGWGVITWLLGIPSSSSHALIGGLTGAAIAGFGLRALHWAGLGKVLLALFVSPPLGMLVGYVLMKLILFLAQGATPHINLFFKRGQVLAALGLALPQGANDAQKAMGVITLGLVVSGALPAFEVPLWVVAVCAGVFALGTSLGGWRLIRTLGGKFYTIRPVHGFSTQLAAAGVLLGAVLLGGPVSTTQVVSSVIIGVGSAERISKVRWNVAGQIATAWLLTIPMTALLAAGVYVLIRGA
ncbi:MAG TPA: inorganic phosphate transporter [Anaerolineae bacterium]|nr:inorganic phosphate transporter [Anaerolineae bacterium]